ncbi:MAG: hypothetical protein P1V35_04360 [Planctomycetota bacterium]|nr:hypothetical protein [Planctomycetota bacterium]
MFPKLHPVLPVAPSRPRPTRRGAKVLVGMALVMGTLTSSCQDTAVASSNLDALLDNNNHLRHYAAVQSGWKYYISTMFDPSIFGVDSATWLREEVAIHDPAYVALENLLILADGKGAREAHRQVIQVRQFSRFATRSPGNLVRERSILELSVHAKRLGLIDLKDVVDPAESETPNANAADLSTLMAGLIDTLEPVLLESSNPTPTQLADFALACGQFDESVIEIDGLWRVLKAIETFAARVDLKRDDLAPLLDLSERLQRRSVALALAAGSVDPSPRVRAATLQSSFAAFGHPVLQEALNQLRRDQPAEGQSRFGWSVAFVVEDTVATTLFTLLARYGWPHLGIPGSYEWRDNRFQDLRSALTIVHNTAQFNSTTRTKAMQALGVLMPDGPQGLHEELWTSWWENWSLNELEEMKALVEDPETPQS